MKYQLEPSTALACNSVVFLLSAVVSPLFGLAIDKTGRNVLWVILGIVVTLGCHATFAFTFLNPFVLMVSDDLFLCHFIYVNVNRDFKPISRMKSFMVVYHFLEMQDFGGDP